ncbi:MAG: hypothetical protein ACRD6U_11745 [Nitrososphaeraceae archaeon]
MNGVQKSIVLSGFTMAITSILLLTIGNNAFALEYTNEQCGVSIQYNEDWQVENDDYKSERLRSFVTIFPDPDDIFNLIYMNIWDISNYREKTIEYLSEIFAPLESGDEIKIDVMQNNIIEVGGFSAQKLVYNEEFHGYKTYFMDINILAYDKVYQIELETEDQEKFDKYAPFVEEIANSIKISKPNFEGINC